MAKKPNIIEAFESPELFGSLFKDQKTWSAWKTFLRALYGLPLSSDDYKMYIDCTERQAVLKTNFEEAYAIVGRRGGKTQTVALIAVYEALFGNWQKYLSRGETAFIFSIATDKTQARIALDYIRGILEIFPDVVEKELTNEIRLKNRVTISVKTCNFRAARGYSTACIILDELAFYRSENSANPAEEVIISLLPSLLPNAKLIGISTPYGKFGYLYQIYSKHFGDENSDILVWRAGTRVMNPQYRQDIIDRLYKRDKSAMKSEFYAEFREDLESYLSEDILERAIVSGCRMVPYDSEKDYHAFVDPSGGRKDSFSMAIAHQEEKRVILDYISEIKPPFNPNEAVRIFADIFSNYRITNVLGDKYAAEWVCSVFKENGIYYKESKLSKSEIFLEFAGLMSINAVKLLDNERMKTQFLSLERKTRSGGNDIVEKVVGMHDDIANSVAGACVSVYKNIASKPTEAELKARLPHLSSARKRSPAESAAEEMHEIMISSGCTKL